MRKATRGERGRFHRVPPRIQLASRQQVRLPDLLTQDPGPLHDQDTPRTELPAGITGYVGIANSEATPIPGVPRLRDSFAERVVSRAILCGHADHRPGLYAAGRSYCFRQLSPASEDRQPLKLPKNYRLIFKKIIISIA